MEVAGIAELLKPFLSYKLSPHQLKCISMYIDILLKWNQRINLTAVRQPEQIVTRHFGESLFAAQHLFPSNAHVGTAAPGRPAEQSSAPQARASFDRLRTGPGATLAEAVAGVPAVVDVGSGAGFPGLPIKIWAPEIRLTLIESNHKKAVFLKEIVRALGLLGVDVFAGRTENFPAASADVVTLRAVERFEDVLPIATRLVKPGGRLALLIGNSQIEQTKHALRNWEGRATLPVPLSNNRALFVAKNLM